MIGSRKLLFFFILVGVVLFCLGLPFKKKQMEQPKEMQTTLKTRNLTSVGYERKREGEYADVELNTSYKPIIANVNGKEYVLENKEVTEEHKFENGKVVINEERQVELKIDIPEPPRLKKGLYVDNKATLGGRISYQTKNYDIDITHEIYKKGHQNERETKIMFTKWF